MPLGSEFLAPRRMMHLRRLARHGALLVCLLPLTGCLVPQPAGKGKESIITEPRTKGQYYLYLPESYVKNSGKHPLYPNRRWPVVMTFHGMKPYDTWDRQIHEWQQEADTYGYIVVAPWLQSCDSFMEYPLTKEHGYVLSDKERVIAIMDHVMATTNADPKAVLSTSWSCGGYLAHYFPNRYPGRFSCIATRLSNFSPRLLLEQNVPQYRDMPVAIFIGDGDFPACKSESEAAVAWYKAKGFKTVIGKTIDNVGHKRLPQTAAAFFAEQIGIQPIYPERAALTLAQVTMTDYQPNVGQVAAAAKASQPPPVQVAQAGGAKQPTPVQVIPPPQRNVSPAPSPRPQPTQIASAAPTQNRGRPSGNAIFAVQPPAPQQRPIQQSRPQPAPQQPIARPQQNRPALPPPVQLASNQPRAEPRRIDPPRPNVSRPAPAIPQPANDRGRSNAGSNAGRSTVAAPPRAQPRQTVTERPARPPAGGSRIRAPRNVNIALTTPAVGPAPHYISFSAELPADLARDADFLWMDNGMWICDEAKGVKILDTPGKHRISVLVVTRDGQEFRGMREVTVLARGADGSSGVRTSMR